MPYTCISKALRYDPCVTRDHTVYLPPTHEPYLPLLPSRKASPPLGRYLLILLGEQRHIGVRNLPRGFTPRARPRLEPTTSQSQVRYSTNSATTSPAVFLCLTQANWYQTAIQHSNSRLRRNVDLGMRSLFRNKYVDSYLCQEVMLCLALVCLSVCLSSSNFTRKNY